MSSADLARLKGPVALLLASLLLVGATLWKLEQSLEAERREQNDAERAYREAHRRYVDARRDEAFSRETIERFRALQSLGVVGDEARLDWVERLKAARESAQLQRLDFELRPRRRLAASPGDSFALTASTMRIHSNLMHEGRLLDFLDQLAAEPSALMHVRSCEIDRLDRSVAAPGLEFDCEIDWITIAATAGKGDQG